MSIFKKIVTAFRGGVREAGEAIVDANGTRILEQEINDAQTHLNKAKHDLTSVMAKQMQSAREVKALEQEIAEHEGYAAQALAKGEEALAMEIAEKISATDIELAEQKQVLSTFSTQSERLKDLVRKTERHIKEYSRQLSMVKTTESVQKASAAISDNFSSSSSKILSAKDTLERIKQRQQDTFDKLDAAQELADEESDKGLSDKMAAAGIGEQKSNAASVLDRIKAKQ